MDHTALFESLGIATAGLLDSPHYQTALLTIIVALFVSIPFITIQLLSTWRRRQKPFPFLRLPPELRAQVYYHLILPEIKYSTSQPRNGRKPLSGFSSLFQHRCKRAKWNWIILASRQTYQEYQAAFAKQTLVKLRVDDTNYETSHFWDIDYTLLTQMRRCELSIAATPRMLEAVDPRHMSTEWAVGNRLCDRLRVSQKLSSCNIDILAKGGPMWNPIWIWYHASQTLKARSDTKINKIAFSLENWICGENHLEKDDKGKWTWVCPEGHFVVDDPGRRQLVREFCWTLREVCLKCHPEYVDEAGEE